MLRSCLILLSIYTALHGAVVLDRIAVIVGRHVVKTSDLERDLRATEFLNRQPLDLSTAAQRKAADRLVEQELIRQEIINGGYSQPTEQDAKAYVNQLRRDRYKGSDEQLRSALARYGLIEDQLQTYMLWQLTVLRFIDQRFRPGVLVTDEDVLAYKKEHGVQNAAPADDAKIRETIAGERVNQAFEEWLDQTKRRTRVQFREAAFGKE